MEQMEQLSTMFSGLIAQAVKVSQARVATRITEDNVFQDGNREVIPYLDGMVKGLLLPGSRINGMENLAELYAKAAAGQSCLLLLEHYSNLDPPVFSDLLRENGEIGTKVDEALVAVAGMKLNEDSKSVAAFTSAFTRIVIYPSRSIQGLNPEQSRAEILRSNSINRAATKALMQNRSRGKIILVFPSGTRYRPWDPGTKRGVREIDSYLRLFDYFCPVAVNGEVLHVRRGDKIDMIDDYVSRDVVWMSAGGVRSSKEFRQRCIAEAEEAGAEDKKQYTVDQIMGTLELMHGEEEERRQQYLAEHPAV